MDEEYAHRAGTEQRQIQKLPLIGMKLSVEENFLVQCLYTCFMDYLLTSSDRIIFYSTFLGLTYFYIHSLKDFMLSNSFTTILSAFHVKERMRGIPADIFFLLVQCVKFTL